MADIHRKPYILFIICAMLCFSMTVCLYWWLGHVEATQDVCLSSATADLRAQPPLPQCHSQAGHQQQGTATIMEDYNTLLEGKSLVGQFYKDKKDLFLADHEKKTAIGNSLHDAAHSALKIPASKVGFYLTDEGTCTVFKDLLAYIVQEYHHIDVNQHTHPHDFNYDVPSDPVGPDAFEFPSPGNQTVNSVRVRIGRNLAGLGFSPKVSKENRVEVERLCKKAFETLNDVIPGQYYALGDLSEETRKQWITDHLLFHDEDEYQLHAGCYRDWPESRGLYLAQDRDIIIWVNEEDHLRIQALEKGPNIGSVWSKINKVMEVLGKALPFARDDKFGWLTACPTNLGTGTRSSVHIQLPNFAGAGSVDELKALCKTMNLEVRGTAGEHTSYEGGVFDVSNTRRFGLTSEQALRDMVEGVIKLMGMEAAAAAKKA